MKKVLVVTYYWPPSGGPGVQRVLKFCKYLPKYGWKPVILTVKDGEYPAMDDTLLHESKDIETHLSHAFSFYSIFNWFTGEKSVPSHQLSKSKDDSFFKKISRWIRYNLVVPDGRIGWYSGAVKKGRKLLNNEKFDLIFSSGPPHSVHLIGLKLAKKSGTKWVADFRDPWTDMFYYSENKRLRAAELLDRYLEKQVVDNADALITVSRSISEYYDRDVTVIPNGYDESDFELIENSGGNNNLISYVGTMYKSQNTEEFFDSVNELNKLSSNKYKINLIGHIHSDIVRYITSNNYESFIKIKPYIHHKESILKMVESEFLLLVIPNTKKNSGIVTGKIFEYIRSGSKILMIGPLDSDAAKIINETNSGYCFDYNDMSNLGTILSNKKILNSIDYSHYSRVSLTKKLVGIFNKTINGSTNINM